MKRSALALTLLALAVGGLTGCTSVKYGDAQSVETTNADFGSTDLHMIATKLTDSLLASGFTVQSTANGNRPVVFVNTVSNKTGSVTISAAAASGPQLSWSKEIML